MRTPLDPKSADPPPTHCRGGGPTRNTLLHKQKLLGRLVSPGLDAVEADTGVGVVPLKHLGYVPGGSLMNNGIVHKTKETAVRTMQITSE